MLPLRHYLVGRCCRAGWIGCNFALNRIPLEARIAVVTTFLSPPQSSAAVPAASFNLSVGRRDACATVIATPEEVRERFKRVKPLGEIKAKERGWTLDVLNIVRRIISEGRVIRDPNISDKSGRRGTPPSDSFTTADVYAFTRELETLHPDNSESIRERAAT